MACPVRSAPLLSFTTFGLYHASCFDVTPCLFAIESIVCPFLLTMRSSARRSSGSSAVNRSAKPVARPTGTRTQSESPGGVMPRNRCALSSDTLSAGTPAALATAASGVPPGVRTES